MSEDIKKTAITAAGYIYQNRQGLKVLCDWLDAPTRYSRVKFECDNENEAPQGLDDIVIERSDGFVDLQQIKFTPDSETHLLSWDWMLEKTGKTERSRSMLRKWFDAFKQLDPVRIGEISLITNRRPDAAIEVCLERDRIDPSKIPEPQRTLVEVELGGVEECKLFFRQLCIRHSDKGYLALEHEVDALLRQHGTPEGIANLKYVALNWATQKISLRRMAGLNWQRLEPSCELHLQLLCQRILLFQKVMRFLMKYSIKNLSRAQLMLPERQLC